MADAKPEAPKPAPTPPKPKVTVAEQARADIAKGQPGFHPTRWLHYASSFVSGTIEGTLNGIAKWGRKGLKWGAIAGLAISIGLPALALVSTAPVVTAMAATFAPLLGAPVLAVAVLAVGAFAAGAAFGGLQGFLQGGSKAMAREVRRDKYAEDLVQRATVRKAAPPNRADYRDKIREQSIRNNFLGNYALDREQENARDTATYWQDRETHSTNGRGRW